MNDYWGKVIQSVAMCIITLGNTKFDGIEEVKGAAKSQMKLKPCLYCTN